MITTQPLTQFPELSAFAELLKANGFDVIVSTTPRTWIHYFKNGQMRYLQKAAFGGWDYSTEHKGNKDFGTGFRLRSGYDLTLENATAGFERSDMGFNTQGKTPIKYWASAQEFCDATTNKWANYFVL